MSAASLPAEIRGVMIPVLGGRVLVPNTTMAEVITYAQPEPVANAPAWLLGRVAWRGWRVPILAFSVFAGIAPVEPLENARVAILKALGGRRTLPYCGVLAQGFPRLTLISQSLLRTDPAALDPPPAGVREQVIVHDEAAWIPDLGALEEQLAGALAAAA